MGDLNPKQKLFCQARAKYVAYGGARGGGKTHVSRIKAIGGAFAYPGIRILFIRKAFPELEQSIILPMKQILTPEKNVKYKASDHCFFFPNDSIIKFSHYNSRDDIVFQGQEWDWIFIDEATQFSESQFRILGACLRGATDIPRRIYLTCNPGGIGHMWVKRLFIERRFLPHESPDDYFFIPATVEDNPQLLRASPDYVQMLDALPEDVRAAWRFGDWGALTGAYFPEFRRENHVIPPLPEIPQDWRIYRAFDYGLDMFACLWIGVDPCGHITVYREFQKENLLVSEAANIMRRLTPQNESVEITFAPPDMQSRQKDSGKSMASLFLENHVPVTFASNRRIDGWLNIKEKLKPLPPPKTAAPGLSCARPALQITQNCENLIRNLQAIQHNPKNPSDCAVEPHDITHICDALRYFCVSRTLNGEMPLPDSFDFPSDSLPSLYRDEMTGGTPNDSYLFF